MPKLEVLHRVHNAMGGCTHMRPISNSAHSKNKHEVKQVTLIVNYKVYAFVQFQMYFQQFKK